MAKKFRWLSSLTVLGGALRLKYQEPPVDAEIKHVFENPDIEMSDEDELLVTIEGLPSGGGGDTTVDQITDATDVGKELLKSTDNAAATEVLFNGLTEDEIKIILGIPSDGLAYKTSVDYITEVDNKPTIPNGALASKNSVDYNTTEVVNKPTLGSLAAKSNVDWATEIANKPTVIAAGATQAEARAAIGAGTSSLSLTGAGGNNGSSSNAARADHTHASIAGMPSINSAAITITSGAGTVDLSARQNFYCDITENTVLTLSGIIYNVEYTIDVVNTDTVQHTISIDGVNYIGNQDFSIPPSKGAVISIKQLSSTRPLRAVISVEPA